MRRHFIDEYGPEAGKRTYYATLNKAVSRGKPINTPEGKRVAKKRHKRHTKGRRSRR